MVIIGGGPGAGVGGSRPLSPVGVPVLGGVVSAESEIPPELQWLSYLTGAQYPPHGSPPNMRNAKKLLKDAAAAVLALIPELNEVRAETMGMECPFVV